MFRCVKLWIHELIDNSFSFFKHSIQWKGYFPRSNVFKGNFSRLSKTIYHNFGTLNPSVTKHYCLGSFRNVFPRILTPVQSLWTHNLTRLSPLDHFYPILGTIFSSYKENHHPKTHFWSMLSACGSGTCRIWYFYMRNLNVVVVGTIHVYVSYYFVVGCLVGFLVYVPVIVVWRRFWTSKSI